MLKVFLEGFFVLTEKSFEMGIQSNAGGLKS